MACGSKLDGTYTDRDHYIKLTFESDSKAIIGGGFSPNVEVDYKIDGKNLKLTVPQGTEVFTLEDRGDIRVSPDVVLTKQKG